MANNDSPSVNLEHHQAFIENDFVITFSTINGSGSITANTILLRAISRMGIPVSGKNIFPSNIQGMPTWYTLRVNQNGYLGRVELDDIIVAMNPSTFAKEFTFLVPGGILLYTDEITEPIQRQDITAIPMPVKALTKDIEVSRNLKGYLTNMVYIGVLVHLLDIPFWAVEEALAAQFRNKQKPIEMNLSIILKARQWAEENIEKSDKYRVKALDPKGFADSILVDGNTAGALGAIYGGVQYVGWYPITPSTSMIEAMHEYIPKIRKDPVTGKDTCIILQAEDELAAVGMVVGAGWAGLRAMTATSGPGLSLMSEYLGMAYFAEVPLVVWDVQRVGPSTGLPTRTSQGDLTFSSFISHGDTEYIILIPGNIDECYEFGWKAFDLAEEYQTPVLVLSDLDLGMNHWVANKFVYPDEPMKRGKVLWEEDLDNLLNKLGGKWGRYMDVDGDGIPYRTLPGSKHPRAPYFTRGTGHDEYAMYREDPEVWESLLGRLKRKLEPAKKEAPQPIIRSSGGNHIGLITMGSVEQVMDEVRALLGKAGIGTDYMRVRALPFADHVRRFIEEHEKCYVIEMNRDGQLRQLLILNTPEYAERLIQLSHIDGLPISARWVVNSIISFEQSGDRI